MSRILILGMDGAGEAAACLCARQPECFDTVIFAGRRSEPGRRVAEAALPQNGVRIDTRQVNPDQVGELRVLLRETLPDLLLNLTLPHQCLTVMDACLQERTPYLDTTTFLPLDNSSGGYARQWDFHNRYRDAGIMAILGCGFVPGVASALCSYAQDHLLDKIHAIDLLRCANRVGKPNAPTLSLDADLHDCATPARFWEEGIWKESPPLSEAKVFNYPGIGPRNSYLLACEAEESLVKQVRGLRRIRYWRSFTGEQLARLRVLQNFGLTRTEPVEYEGHAVVPLQFLKALLPPEQEEPGAGGQTCLACLCVGVKERTERFCLLSCNCDHAAAREAGIPSGDYLRAAPAVAGTIMFLRGAWGGIGVYNVEELDAEPFLAELSRFAIPWQVTWLDEPPAGFDYV